MEAPLCDTFLTGQKLEQFLIDNGSIKIDGHKLINVDAELATESEGFTSKVLRVTLTWSPEDSNSYLPKKLIVKVIGSTKIGDVFGSTGGNQDAAEQIAKNIDQAHDTECAIYELHGLKDVIKMPRCLAAIRHQIDHPGIIVLEDLSDQAVVLSARTIGLDFNDTRLEELLQTLTSIHTWSLNTDSDWKKTIPTFPECHALLNVTQMLRGCFPHSKSMYPEVFENLDEEKILNSVTDEKYLEIYGGDPKKRYNLPLVLVHGDVHNMNMLFEKKSGTEEAGDRLFALIDWQVAHQGCGVEDLIRVFTVCVSCDTRRNRGDEMLQRYVQLFNEKVTKSENRISFNDVKRAFNEMFAFYGILAGCALSIMDAFASHFNGTEEEKNTTKKRWIEEVMVQFKDGVKILGL